VFEVLANFTYKRRWATLLAGALVVLAAVASLMRGGRLTGGAIHGLESEHAQALIDGVTKRPADTTFIAVFRAKRPMADALAFEAAVADAVRPLREHPDVVSVLAPEPHLPVAMPGPSLVDPKSQVALAFVSLRGDFKEALDKYPAVRAELKSTRLSVECTGRVPFLHDLDETLAHDLLIAELVSLPLALFVLLVVFGSVVAAILPVFVGGLAVLSGIAVVLWLSHHMELAEYTINVCSLIGLGVGIDYSLFMVSRYREALAEGHDHRVALAHALNGAGRVVAFSGVAVFTGLAGLLFFRGSYLEAMGIGGAIVVAFAVVFALTLLPALLAVLGPRIELGAMPWRRRKLGAAEGFWHRAAEWVMHRPVRVLVASVAVLCVLGAPFLRLKTASADIRVLPEDTEAHRAFVALGQFFPEQAKTRVAVAVEFPEGSVLTPERLTALHDLSRRLHAVPGVSGVESLVDVLPVTRETLGMFLAAPTLPQMAPGIEMAKRLFVSGKVTVLYATTSAAPESEAARAIVRTLRGSRSVADGQIFVGGRTAEDLDATEYVKIRTPRAVAFVSIVTAIVLFVLLGSVLLPLKALAMNLLSLAGSFGALVWIFQEGHLLVSEGRPLEPSLPVLLFCILFGLSMDYEVLMLSRMREAWLRTGDNTLAVAEGLEKSAGLITSAAAIMVAVFAAFALARVVLIRAVGFGAAFAVLLDATLVRVMLVPSTMRLLGRLNWWAPRFLGGQRTPRS
jgi:uncharacterized membrane protein YdfJ with MMPL/SSD domain